MNSGTSTVPSLVSQQIPSRTFRSSPASPTVFSSGSQILHPRTTPSPSACPPNEVVIDLATTLLITDYSRFWQPTPIFSFHPTYIALGDGSLVTLPFTQDLWNANLTLLVTGTLAMLFTRNILVSIDYIRRGKLKRKTLFYILLVSQLLAPVSLVPVILSYFYQHMNCMVVIMLSCVTGTVSLALLITGILGVKAYKCLNNPRFVFVMLGFFQCASIATVALDITTMTAARRISGSCIRTSDLRFTRYFVTVQFSESLFICCCFLLACWRSRGSSAVRGRISLALSMDELPIEIASDSDDGNQRLRRGWWDYVPAPEKEGRAVALEKFGFFSSLKRKLWGYLSFRTKDPQETPLRKNSSGEGLGRKTPIPIDPSEGFTGLPDRSEKTLGTRGRNSPTPSSGTRLSRLIPRMELFREVMRDELFYTTFITASCVIVAVLALIGVNFNNGLTVTGWIALNWGLISVLAIHSFGRVVRRHERDALLTHPVTCTAIARTAHANIAARDREAKANAATIVTPVSLSRRNSLATDSQNPFSDNQRLEEDRTSWNSRSIYSNSSLSRPPSPLVSVRPSSIIMAANLPHSALDSEFPSSGRGTPLVQHLSADGTIMQGFTQSWLFERNSNSDPHSSDL